MKFTLWKILLAPILLIVWSTGLVSAQATWYDQGKAATDNNRKVEYYTKSLEVEGESVWTYYQRGWAYYALGRYEKGLRDFEKAEKIGGNIQEQYLYVGQGWCFYNLERYPEALAVAEKALKAKPDFVDALSVKGWCLIQQDDSRAASEVFTRLVTLEPNKAKWYAGRSFTYLALGEYAKVVSDCDKALSIDPKEDYLLQRKALALIKLGRNDEGIALVKDKLNFKEDDPRSLSSIGNVFYDNEDYRTAIEYHTQGIKLYEKKCQQDREYIKIYREDIYNIFMSRGYAHQALDDKQRALADFKQATTIKPEDHRAWMEIGELQTFQENWSEGAFAYERGFAIKPDIKYGWVNLGFCYDKLNQPEKAINAYTRGIKNNPEVGLLYNNRGFGYLEMKRYDEAFADLNKAIEVEPLIVMSHVSLGEYFYARKMFNEAINKLTEALKMEDGTVSSYTAAYYTRGLCYFDQQQYERAKADFMEAIKLTPKHVMAHEKLGISYFNLGDQCSAYKTLKKTLDLESTVANKEAKEAPKYLGKMTINPCTK